MFLGFINFYRRFIAHYARIVRSMTDLLKHNQPSFIWTNGAERAMQVIKAEFADAKILRHFDPELRMRLETDASNCGLCGIASQLYGDRWHPKIRDLVAAVVKALFSGRNYYLLLS